MKEIIKKAIFVAIALMITLIISLGI